MNEFKSLLQEAHLSAYEFSKMTGQPMRTVYGWLSDKPPECPPVALWGLTLYLQLKNSCGGEILNVENRTLILPTTS